MSPDHRKTILLVEDEAIIALAEKSILERFGYAVIIAGDGEEAVAAARRTAGLDLILMDIDLGRGMDGTEAAALILKERDLPVVFLSSHVEPEIVARTEKITSYGYVVKDSSATVHDVSIKMAFKLFAAQASVNKKEEELRNRNHYIESILDNMPIGFAANTIDDGVARYLNGKFTEIYGWPKETLTDIDRFFANVYPGPEGQELKARVIADISSGDPDKMVWDDLRITTARGEQRYISARNIPIPGQNLMVSTVWDTTRIHQSQKELRESENLLRAIYDSASDAIMLTAPDGKILAANPSACRMFEMTEEELCRLGRSGIVDQTDPRLAPAIEERKRTGIFKGELLFIRKNGARFPAEISSVIFTDKDGNSRTSMTIRDVTERKKAEDEIQRQLAEKEILLKEVHHRIKNNIAAISSLIAMRLQRVTHPEAVATLKETVGRIDSMRILYDKLLLSEGYKDISVKNYLLSLTAAVMSLFPDHSQVSIDQQISDFPLDAKRLFPLGIIINELLTNIMKHAYEEKQNGRIRLDLTKAGNRVTLTLQDDGSGLPEGFNAAEAKGFGLMLVNMLAQQLQGSFTIEKQKGTRCTVIFEV